MIEHKISISRIKLNHLFNNVYKKCKGGRNFLARKLRISSTLLDNYLKLGKEYIEQYEDKLIDILDIDTEFIEENLVLKKTEIKEEFLSKTEESGISDRNRNAFDVYYYDILAKTKEAYIFETQKSVIENTIFSEIEDENEKIKILIQFRLIYDRAQLAYDEKKVYLVDKYTESSSKHVSYQVKELERRNPEDFAPPEKEKTPTQQIGTINNIFQLVQSLDEAKQLEKKDYIDVEFEKTD